LVVVTAGGGYDAYPLMRACVEAFKFLGDERSIEAIVITGPLMDPDQRESLRRQVEHLPVRVLRTAERISSYLNVANLVITMSSYNTLMDVVRLSKPVLVVPREGPSAEQRIRAQLFSRLGLARAISPEQLSPPVFARVILDNLDVSPTPPKSLNMDGLTNVVRNMRRLLHSTKNTVHSGPDG
jgi:predicted glycosyltransferase